MSGPPRTAATPLPDRSPAPGHGPALEVLGVSKAFGNVRALSNVSFSVPAGEIVGLLGPNGAGKSTMMKGILGLLKPDSGVIRLFGRPNDIDPTETKRSVGYVPESPSSTNS